MSKKITQSLPDRKRILPVRFLLLDVDGVMTDGTISYTENGGEIKSFDAKDGAGDGAKCL